ncbi:MAG TPA: putative lipid II flippase FtsW [Candidatus Limnocylindrales bacterium]|nr:putative lipid II flippase FtsW [Candidatus Limnocylindrales bacterium]
MRRPRLPDRTAYDLSLLGVVLALLAIGLLMVYSASGMRALDSFDDPDHFLIQQSLWAVVGVAAMAVTAGLDYHRYRRLALPLLVLVLVLLVLVLVPGIGTRVNGAARWLRLSPSLGVQPAELAKIALILYLSFWLGARRGDVARPAVTLGFLALTGLVAGLVVVEPDLGTAVVIGAVAFTLYFSAGARLLEVAALGTLGGVLVAALAVAQPYRLERVLTFLDPWSDPRDAGFQTIQSLYGLALGGPFGEGLGAGKEKFGFLPAPYTDSIFAVIGNELGLVGTLAVILLYLALAFKGTRIALRAPDRAGGLIAIGITVWLAGQAWLNMAVVASLVPMTGITLPFISYGGSSLCVALAAVGILLNVGRQGSGFARADPRARATVPGAPRGRRDGRPRQPAPRGGRGGARGRAGGGVPVHRWAPRSRG